MEEMIAIKHKLIDLLLFQGAPVTSVHTMRTSTSQKPGQIENESQSEANKFLSKYTNEANKNSSTFKINYQKHLQNLFKM